MTISLSKLAALEAAIEYLVKATPGEQLEYLSPGEKPPSDTKIHTTERGAQGYYPSEVLDTKIEISQPSKMSRQEFEDKRITQQEMLERGADGHLSSAVEIDIPLNLIEGLEPVPDMEGGYQEGTPVTQPVEIKYDDGQFILYAGNHRVQQAKVNGDSTIPAFVENLKYSDLKTAFEPRSLEPTEEREVEVVQAPELPKSGIELERDRQRNQATELEALNLVSPQDITDGGYSNVIKRSDANDLVEPDFLNENGANDENLYERAIKLGLDKVTVWHGTTGKGATGILTDGAVDPAKTGGGFGAGFNMSPKAASSWAGGKAIGPELQHSVDRLPMIIQFDVPVELLRDITHDQSSDAYSIEDYQVKIPLDLETTKILYSDDPDAPYPNKSFNLLNEHFSGVPRNLLKQEKSLDLSVTVPDDSSLYGVKAADHQLRQPNGSPVRGTPMSLDDPRIPETVYHMTTNAPAIRASKKLIAGGVGGLGGDASDQIISLTINKEIAYQLAEDTKLASEIGRMRGGEHRTPERAEASKAILKRLNQEMEKEGWDSKMFRNFSDDPSNEYMLEGLNAREWLKEYFKARARETDDEKRDPLFFTEPEDLAKINPENVDVIEIPKNALRTGAMITDFDLDSPYGLQEIRVYGDVGVSAEEKSDNLSKLLVLEDYLSKATMTTDSIRIGNLDIPVEIATDPVTGLSWRDSLAPGTGMLFDLGDHPVITMKGMKFPLDLVWMADGRVVYLTENALVPVLNQESLYIPEAHATAVLEINGGEVQRLGIKIGDFVEGGNFLWKQSNLSKLLVLETALDYLVKSQPGEKLEYLSPGEKPPGETPIRTTPRGATGYYPSEVVTGEGEATEPSELEPGEEREIEVVQPEESTSTNLNQLPYKSIVQAQIDSRELFVLHDTEVAQNHNYIFNNQHTKLERVLGSDSKTFLGSEIKPERLTADNLESVGFTDGSLNGIDEMGSTGINAAHNYTVKVDGKRFIYKTMYGDNRAEMLSYSVDRALGLNIVPYVKSHSIDVEKLYDKFLGTWNKSFPLTSGGEESLEWLDQVTRLSPHEDPKRADAYLNELHDDLNLGGGHFMEFCENCLSTSDRDRAVIEMLMTAEGREEFIKVMLLDLIIANPDRHTGNWMLTDDHKMIAIDNGLAGDGAGMEGNLDSLAEVNPGSPYNDTNFQFPDKLTMRYSSGPLLTSVMEEKVGEGWDKEEYTKIMLEAFDPDVFGEEISNVFDKYFDFNKLNPVTEAVNWKVLPIKKQTRFKENFVENVQRAFSPPVMGLLGSLIPGYTSPWSERLADLELP